MRLYSVQSLVPTDIDLYLRQHIEPRGLSWSPWGGHITLIPRFRTDTPESTIVEDVGAAVADFAPITVTLNNLHIERHIGLPDQFVLLLTAPEPPTGLMIMQAHLKNAMRPYADYIFPAFFDDHYSPHITLSIGLNETQARHLLVDLLPKKLQASFVLSAISLMIHEDDQHREVRFTLQSA